MTIIVNPPAVEVEHASRELVAALMLKAVRDHGLSWPRDIHHMEGAESGDLLDIGIDGRGPWLGWVDFFGEPEYRSGLVVHIPWRGWTVLLSYREVATTDAETAALIDQLTTESAATPTPWCELNVKSLATCRDCGGEVVHRAGCPSEPEHLADHYAESTIAAAEKLPVLVFDVTPNPAPSTDIDDTIARLFDDDARLAVDELDDLPAVSVEQLAEAATVEPDARVYVPVPMPTGVQANAAECARLNGEMLHRVPTGLPLLVNGHVPVAPGHHDVQIVEVTDVTRGPLVERDDNAAMARVLPEQRLFAEAADRLALTGEIVEKPKPWTDAELAAAYARLGEDVHS